jgi:hypothetical protein
MDNVKAGFNKVIERSPRVILKYALFVQTCPWMFFFFYIFCILVFVVSCWRPLVVDTNFATFVKADGEAMLNRQAYLSALNSKKDLKDSRRLSERLAEEDRRLDMASQNVQPGAEGPIPDDMLENDVQPHWGTAEPVDEDDEDSRHLSERLAGDDRRLDNHVPLYVIRELTLVYVAKGGDALDERVLREVRDFELRLRSLSEWKDQCAKSMSHQKWQCDPGYSLAALAWPSQVAEPEPNSSHDLMSIQFDGGGNELLPLPALLTYMQQATKGPAPDYSRSFLIYFPKGFEVPEHLSSDELARPTAIRSRFRFLIVYGYEGEPLAKILKQRSEAISGYKTFFSDGIHPILKDANKDLQHINVYYSGDSITEFEVLSTLFVDILYAVGSLIFVTIFLWFYIRSALVSVGCFCIIFASVPLAYVMTPSDKATVATFMSLFLITVIDIDVIFVFIDFWEQSAKLEEVDKRLVWMIVHAGRSCLATSTTTALGFFANLASSLKALREFGLFMGLSVLVVYVLALAFLPPLIVIRERRRAKERERLEHRVVDVSASALAVIPGPEQAKETTPSSFPGTPVQTPSTKSKMEAKMRSLMPGGDKQQQVFLLLMRYIARCPCTIVVLALACLPVFVTFIIRDIQVDTGLPEIFPPWHNQVAGKKASGEFASVTLKVQKYVKVELICTASYWEEDADPTTCALNWCDGAQQTPSGEEIAGICMRSPTFRPDDNGFMRSSGGNSTEGCGQLSISTRLAIDQNPDDALWSGDFADMVREVATTTGLLHDFPNQALSIGAKEVSPLTFEIWESGTVATSKLFQAGTVFANGTNTGTRCEVKVMCFTGQWRCDNVGWQNIRTFNTSTSRRLTELSQEPSREVVNLPPVPRVYEPLHAFRRLAVVSPSRRADITVVWGIQAPRAVPLVGPQEWLWKYDPTFEPQDPWAQRALLRMCEPDKQLLVLESTCWISSFKEMLQTEGKRFPSRTFDDDVVSWYNSHLTMAQSSLWMESRKVKACKFAFIVNFDKHIKADITLDYKERWDDYVEKLNDVAPLTANKAYHSTGAWVSAEATIAIVMSTLITVLIECACGYLGIVVFTGDPALATLVLFLVLENISGVLFFMLSLMGWTLGPIEIIFLVVFLGYSVTFGLHMAVNYSEVQVDDQEFKLVVADVKQHKLKAAAKLVENKGESDSSGSEYETDRSPEEKLTKVEIRTGRTTVAVLHVGSAIGSATFCTVGSSIFLLICTLQIFVKLGCVIIVVVALSLIFTLIALPAVLIVVGPAPVPCHKRVFRSLVQAIQRMQEGPPVQGDFTEGEPLVPQQQHDDTYGIAVDINLIDTSGGEAGYTNPSTSHANSSHSQSENSGITGGAAQPIESSDTEF